MLYRGRAFEVDAETYCDALECISVFCLITAFVVVGFLL